VRSLFFNSGITVNFDTDIDIVECDRFRIIEMVMQVAECNFRQALAWLHDRFDFEGMLL
jgi:hypothetical protein